MNCGTCGELIPADSMFCPECGARQDNSVAGGFAPAPNQSLPNSHLNNVRLIPCLGQHNALSKKRT